MVTGTARVVRRTLIDIPSRIAGPRQVKVGFPKGKADSDVINRAIWNEFGTRGGASGGGWGGPIPERPFMRNAMRNNLAVYHKMLKSAASQLVTGKTTLFKVMYRLGFTAQGHIQGEITSLRSPPNAAVTIERKGSSNPLIDSGEMRGKVTFKVDD